MAKIMRNFRIEKELWEKIPTKNKSKFVRQIVDDYIHNRLLQNSDIKAIESENKTLLQLVEAKTQHIEDLQKTIAGLLPAPKRYWWQFWKK